MKGVVAVASLILLAQTAYGNVAASWLNVSKPGILMVSDGPDKRLERPGGPPPPGPAPSGPPPPSPVYPLELRNLLVSHGFLQPDWDPSNLRYTLSLNQPVDQLAIVPEIDRLADSYAARGFPILKMSWPSNPSPDPEPSSLAAKQQIDLPDDGSDMTVNIQLSAPAGNPTAPAPKPINYRVKVVQAFPPPTMLKRAEGYDDTGNALLISPTLTQDAAVYNVFVSPNANKLYFTIGCNTKSQMFVNSRSTTNGQQISITRDKSRHTQVLEVTCQRKNPYPGVPEQRKYAFLIQSDWPTEQIAAPRLIVDDVGRECVFDENAQSYRCPDPKTDTHKTRIISSNEPTIKYVLTSSNQQVQVRLIDRQPSIPFTYSNSLTLTAYAGQFSKSWPVSFSGTALPSILQVFGWILALLLLILLIALFCVIGAANIFGLGVPLGATEVAATLTLIIQYLCFANFMRGSTVLNEMVAPLKWVTIFWPLPWRVGDTLKRRQLLDVPTFSSPYGLELWGESSLGDVTDIRNACGCIFWSTVLFGVFVLIHLGVYSKFAIWESDYTFPHRVRWGNWESRTLHWLAFPAAAGASMVLASDITTTTWKVLGGFLLAVYVGWVGLAYSQVQSNVSERKVCWVWNASVREDGSIEDVSGYWMDVQADQLQTQPVNRSLCKGLFPYQWISTVADIHPVSVSAAMFQQNEEIYPPRKYARAHKEASYPLAKNPQVVEVTRTRAPGGPCKGQRLISGLLRTQWLDILFTYQGLTRFHSQVSHDTGNFSVPLITKTSQLAGPLTSGRNAFFYDGARIPFIRIADFLYRIAIGVFVGVALASEGYKVDAVMFAFIAILSSAFLAYVATTKPYSRVIENWLVVTMLATIAFSASSFVFYAAKRQDPSWVADIFLWLVAACCILLAAYSCIVTFSVFSALFCPPLDESRFLEKLANCNVTVSDEQTGWSFDVPAFSKFAVKDLKAHCTLTGNKRVHVRIYTSGEEPTLEFSSSELRGACKSGYLVPPVCIVFVPSSDSLLGYKYFSVANKDEVHQKIAEFLSSDHETRFLADEVGRDISHQVEVKGRGKTILSVTIIPPKGVDFATRLNTASTSGRAGDSMTTSSMSQKRSRRSK